MSVFGISSKNNLKTCHKDIQLINNIAIKICPVDYSVTDGYRSPDIQLKYFKLGKTKLDGIHKMSKHNENPSKAFDFCVYVVGKKELRYDKIHLVFVAAYLIAVADMLYSQKLITHRLRWGGNWDSDGELIFDQTFVDLPHLELY